MKPLPYLQESFKTLLLMALMTSCVHKPNPANLLSQGTWIDLTWPFDEQSV